MTPRARLRRLPALVLALACAPPLAAQAHHHEHAPPTAQTNPDDAPRDDGDDRSGQQDRAPREPIPVVTDADRAAAFPAVRAHAAHGNAVLSYWLVDRLEVFDAGDDEGAAWEASGWIGNDLDRLWLRSEGEQVAGDTEAGDLELFYGRNVARWWDLLVGLRHDFGEGPSQTFLAFGAIGLAPYKFEIEATAYLGESGQTAARIEAEYDTLLTNRLVLQWQAEAEFHGRDDAARGVGSGLGTLEAGLRLRYEFTRRFAPYIGVAWERAYGGTADLRGADPDDIRWVVGLRTWF